MTLRAALAGAMLLCASLGFAAPSPAAEPGTPGGTLSRGGSYVIDADPTVGAAAIGLWFRAPGAGYDNATPGIARLAATAAAAAPLASGKSLVELVHSLGGELNINVYPDIVGIGAVVPAAAARRIVAGMTAAYFAPSINDAAVKIAQRDAAVLAVQQRYSADATLHDLAFEQIFTAGPAHYPPIPDSVAQLTHIPPAQVSAFAKRAFRSNNSILTMSGNVDASSVDAVTDGSGNGSMDAPFDSTVMTTPPAPSTQAGQADGLALAWVGPPIADEKSATAMDFVADYLFREDTGIVARALDEQHGDTYALGQFITLHDPGVMLVTVGGDHAKDAKTRILAELTKLSQPLPAAAFVAAREAFLYHIASDTQTPQEQADNLGWYAVEGSAGYAPGDKGGEYERVARTLDPQYVADMVRRYLQNPVVINLVSAPPAKEPAS